MSKLNNALYQIDSLSHMAQKDVWINNIHPLVKLFTTILYIGLAVSFPKDNFLGLLSFGLYPLVIFLFCDISFKEAVHRMRIVLPVVCCVGILNPFFDRQLAFVIGNFRVSQGMVSFVTLMLKGVFTVLASYILIATTSIEKLCLGLRSIHFPRILVVQILLVYRYVSVMILEAQRISQAYSLRAPGQRGIKFSAWGSFVGELLLRSMDRAQEIYESMSLRGFDGDFKFAVNRTFSFLDGVILLSVSAAFVCLRIFPVFTLVGGLFV